MSVLCHIYNSVIHTYELRHMRGKEKVYCCVGKVSLEHYEGLWGKERVYIYWCRGKGLH